MKTRILVSLFNVFVCSLYVFSQAKKIEIDVAIHSSGSKVESDLRNYLSRELRTLGDVDLVESGALTINVIEIGLKTTNNTVVGHALAYTITEVISCQGNIYSNTLASGLETTDLDGMSKTCEIIITKIDKGILEKR